MRHVTGRQASMPEQRIILANGSRLLRDMLKRIIVKSENLNVVREVTDQKELPAAIEHSNPQWVIVSLAFDNGIPAWVDNFIAIHPSVRFMAVASDGSKVKMKWLEIHEQELNGLSLSDLIQILENKPVNP
jgi:DNA-binding NarL/FixJ family response regulator